MCGYSHTQTHTSYIKVSVYTRNNNRNDMIVMSENSKLSKYFTVMFQALLSVLYIY